MEASSQLKRTNMESNTTDLICLSHLRWGFVYQRPQHLLSRFARKFRVFFVEEPIHSGGEPRLEVRVDPESGVHVIAPHMAAGLAPQESERLQAMLLKQWMSMARVEDFLFWYYTPMALGFTREFTPALVIYDCMDELSAFRGAPPALRDRERELFERANLVFTGGQSLYEAKRGSHPDLHAFASSVDTQHFMQARQPQPEPADQAALPHPRIGYCGVIDERMDLELIAQVADMRPDWQLMMIGPVVKIDPATLPRRRNIHYLGSKTYKELPRYLSGWDAAMLPFAINESTQFISPTKTPEYLAAGLPSVSTPIRDVVRPFGNLGLVGIASEAAGFVKEIEAALAPRSEGWQDHVDEFLKQNSWDVTWRKMMNLITPRLIKTEVLPAQSPVASGKAISHV
jgi:glycosyltransferase involved in cell wall biosynthesis